MKKLDYSNPTARVVVCTTENSGKRFPNGELLHLGKRYHLYKIMKINGSAVVYLEEFPDKTFNAEHFSEIFCSKEEIEKELRKTSRKKKLLGTVSNFFPKLALGAENLEIEPEWDIIRKLKPDEIYSIGNNNSCSLNISQTYISGIHCYVYKIQNNKYGIVDCSVYGTYLLL